jgi:predicted Zn-dependent protease with MMP-like domain
MRARPPDRARENRVLCRRARGDIVRGMSDLEELTEDIERALDEGEYEEALDLADEALETHRGSAWLHAYRGEALAGLGEYSKAVASYRDAASLAPDLPQFPEALADLLFRTARFQEARGAAERALALDKEMVGALDLLARLAERDGKIADADALIERARAVEPEIPRPARMSEKEFREVVTEALERLPDEFSKALKENLAIVVDRVPSEALIRSIDPPLDPTILGYYVGVPLPERQPSNAPPALPDVIYLFQTNLEHECGDREELLEEIATTAYHEVAHFLGFDEDEMEDLGLE